MSWTAPRTWVAGETLTAANLNTHLRDNMLETGPAKVTAAGDMLYATAANTLARLAKPVGFGAVFRNVLAFDTDDSGPFWRWLAPNVYQDFLSSSPFALSTSFQTVFEIDVIPSWPNSPTLIFWDVQVDVTMSSAGYFRLETEFNGMNGSGSTFTIPYEEGSSMPSGGCEMRSQGFYLDTGYQADDDGSEYTFSLEFRYGGTNVSAAEIVGNANRSLMWAIPLFG